MAAVKGLKIFTTYSSGLFAGSTLYVSVVDHRTRLSSIKEMGPDKAMLHFKLMHDHVEKLQIPLLLNTLVGATATFFMCKGDPRRKFWLLGVGAMMLMVPLTGAHINPKYREPMCKDPQGVASKGPEHVEKMLRKWHSTGHGFRTLLGSTAFLIFLATSIV